MNDTAQAARDLYEEMGAVPVINAVGNMTMLGGSSPAASVREAMDIAQRYFVDMDQLLAGSGRVVADLLGCEAALVTPGCASALLLGTAACVAGDDPERMSQLPDTTGMKGQVVLQASQRYKYERVVRMAGVELVIAGTPERVTTDDVAAAIGPQTAAVLCPVLGTETDAVVPLATVVEIARGVGVPVIADAAYQVDPADHMRATASSADLVGFGAKYFNAPNSSGLLCGRADLIEAARAHTFAAFERRELAGIGRPLKIDRQEVIAVVMALREWLGMDRSQRDAELSFQGRALRDAVEGLAGVTCEPATGDGVTGLRIIVDDAQKVADALRAGSPSIWCTVHDTSLFFGLRTVHPGDEMVIAERLQEVLS
ncbi:MAG: hypothetical protein CME24_21260 [Gemmatimonadetes bacterium]|nr:hypothetical protein [Gemmatimonadota bacterium]